jgi:hypothetical protein
MIKTENIFSLWEKNDKRLPIIVKRDRWDYSYVIVTKIEPKGDYGKVWGTRFFRGDIKGEYGLIDCSGCGGWGFYDIP